ncbi:hypothetical protein WG66_008877 [Moniliophthora roreri]|uniref:Uncharacterized protein n=1 Tax=Moniliophthora roreri TaxID=221103 RepID=A0A0W0EUB0_MONRR|nr:hypothetical protein WG66_008877 [Moniliophthora roreri]
MRTLYYGVDGQCGEQRGLSEARRALRIMFCMQAVDLMKDIKLDKIVARIASASYFEILESPAVDRFDWRAADWKRENDAAVDRFDWRAADWKREVGA